MKQAVTLAIFQGFSFIFPYANEMSKELYNKITHHKWYYLYSSKTSFPESLIERGKKVDFPVMVGAFVIIKG